jgi:hypothetical protein
MAISGIAVALAFVPSLAQAILGGNLPIFLLIPAVVAVGLAVYANR